MEKKIFNLLILDESGSMQSISKEAIAGYNQIIQTIKDAEVKYPNQKQHITLVTFNSNGIKTVFDRLPIAQIVEFETRYYNPNFGTPLWDAVGESVNNLVAHLKEEKDYAVLVSILTDGYENASQKYTALHIRQLIELLSKDGWTFSYIGTDHDVYKVAEEMSIPKGNAIYFEKGQFEKEASQRIAKSMNKFSKAVFWEKYKGGLNDIFKDEEDHLIDDTK